MSKLTGTSDKDTFIIYRIRFGISTTSIEVGINITGKEFALLSFCLEDNKSVLLDFNNTPQLSVIKGVRMSSAVPFIFKPIEYSGKLYVDGFISDNTPSNFVKYPNNCLGIHVYPIVKYDNSKLDFFDFLRITFTSPMNELDLIKYKKHSDRMMILRITKNMSYFFNVNSEDILSLINTAYQQMQKQIKKIDS